jgi:hypothetical protein
MYAAVLPAKDHTAAICSVSWARSAEVNGQTVECTSDDQCNFVGAAAAIMWTDRDALMTHIDRSGVSRFHLEGEILERAISMCPHGHTLSIQHQEQASLDKVFAYHHRRLPPEEFAAWEKVVNSSLGDAHELHDVWGLPTGEIQGIEGIMEIARK